jgi:hypothetical protein
LFLVDNFFLRLTSLPTFNLRNSVNRRFVANRFSPHRLSSKKVSGTTGIVAGIASASPRRGPGHSGTGIGIEARTVN